MWPMLVMMGMGMIAGHRKERSARKREAAAREALAQGQKKAQKVADERGMGGAAKSYAPNYQTRLPTATTFTGRGSSTAGFRNPSVPSPKSSGLYDR